MSKPVPSDSLIITGTIGATPPLTVESDEEEEEDDDEEEDDVLLK